jgi:hypothetical protein
LSNSGPGTDKLPNAHQNSKNKRSRLYPGPQANQENSGEEDRLVLDASDRQNGTWKVSRTFVRISCSYRLSQKIVGSVAGKTPANLRKKFRFASLPEHITSGGLELESPVMAEEDCQGESVSI